MTKTYLAFAAPVAHAELCNRLANDLGVAGQNFTVPWPQATAQYDDHGSPIEADPVPPEYLCGGMHVSRNFVAVLLRLPRLPDHLAGQVSLTPEDLQRVADVLVFEYGDRAGVFQRVCDRLSASG